MGNLSKEKIKKNEMKISELKDIITEISGVAELSHRCDDKESK